MSTPKAILIGAALLAVSIIISPIALELFKYKMCINAGYIEAFCVDVNK